MKKDVKILENLEYGLACQKCVFLHSKDICNGFEILPESKVLPIKEWSKYNTTLL